MAARRVLILGSTGSIGLSTLDVVRSLRGGQKVVGLAANRRGALLLRQVRAFRPRAVALADGEAASQAAPALKKLGVRLFRGPGAAEDLVRTTACDTVLAGIVGSAGLPATYQAVRLGRRVGLANKEALVVAGDLMTREARRSGARLLAVDSEHAAVTQCLQGLRHPGELRRVILTASGGPFLRWTAAKAARASRAQALKHPTWKMGAKISVDSATLMNKGLEVIEARYLFDLPVDKISVVIHPQSVVHSMVEYADGTILAQLGSTDMRVPIQYALTHPARLPGNLPRFEPGLGPDLTFEPVPRSKFPCLGLAFRALRAGGLAPGILNAANETAVRAFLAGTISFGAISRLVAAELHHGLSRGLGKASTLRDCLETQALTVRRVQERIDRGIRLN